MEASNYSATNLNEAICSNVNDYIKKTIELSSDTVQLKQLKTKLEQKNIHIY